MNHEKQYVFQFELHICSFFPFTNVILDKKCVAHIYQRKFLAPSGRS